MNLRGRSRLVVTRRRAKVIALWSVASVLVLGLLGGLSIVALFWFYGRDVEAIDERALREYRPAQVTRIVARDGETVIGEIYEERRTFIPYEEIPSHVENAFLAAEDADFYRHEGMDYFGMVRALLVNLQAGEVKQGASTITQQVVKNFMLSPERTLERKTQELILARRLEQVLSKQEILELYLNDVFMGHGRYGIEEASQFFFGKSVRDIDVGQAALLATLPKAPSKASPFQDRARAKNRQVYVLEQMAKHGFASPRDVKRYIDADLDLGDEPSVPRVHRGADEFVDRVHADLRERYGEERLRTLGATVVTTVDVELQAAARKAVRDGLTTLDTRRQFGHGIKPAKPKNLERARKKGAGALEVGKVYPVVVQEREAGLALPQEGFPAKIGEHQVFVRVPAGSRYDEPDASYLEQFPAGGITMGRVVTTSPRELPEGWALAEIGSGPEAAFLLADVETGEVLAMVGGDAYARGHFNRATSARRQPGSAFKPFVYGAALASRKFTLATLVSDSPEIYEKWRPTNFERDVYRGDIRVREALTHSVNTVAIKLLDAVGVSTVIEFARQAGIESELAKNLSLALGTSEVTPLELMTGYLTLARGGSRLQPQFIRSVEVVGEDPWRPTAEDEQSLDSEVVFLVTSLMQSVVQDGTGKRAKALERPVAGKTGTSADNRDAWFAGFTKNHVAVAWVGFDIPKRIGNKETGGRAAAPIWLAAMQVAEKGREPEPFVPPAEVSVRTIDRASGLLAPAVIQNEDGTEAPPPEGSLLEEFFLAGTEPTEFALPEAMPTDDVLLDLYGDAPSDPPTPPTDDEVKTPDGKPVGDPPPSNSDDGLPGVEE
jgi:penicillin-binding protein 1A